MFGFSLPPVLSLPMAHPGPFTISPEKNSWVQAEEALLSLLESAQNSGGEIRQKEVLC